MSSVNQPERVTFDSINDPQQSSGGATNTFVNYFVPSILAPSSISLLRAAIPLVGSPNIPNYQLVFYYYAVPNSTTVPTAANLRAVRLYPSNYIPPNGFTAFTRNRFVTNGADLVSLLNTAAATGGDSVTYNKLWNANDVTFQWNNITQTISWTGNAVGSFYSNAGWNDPAVIASQNALVAGANSISTFNIDSSITVQPQLIETTLNLRLGYAQSGTATPDGTFGAGVIAGYGAFSPLNANTSGRSFPNNVAVPSDTYPNLVLTQCIYIYCDFIVGIGQPTRRNLMAIIPVDVPQFGVIQYTPTTASKFRRIPAEIYQMRLTLLDDNSAPFSIPDSANFNAEFQIHYDEVKS